MIQSEDLFRKLSQRDYTGSKIDEYAQLLQTIFLHLSGTNEIPEFLQLLKKAVKENKQISIYDPTGKKDEYFFKDLILI